MSYEGPAVIINEGSEIPVTVRLTVEAVHEVRTLEGEARPLVRRWEGFGEPVDPGRPPILPMSVSVVRLPDGREGQAYVSVHHHEESGPLASLEIAGLHEPPFDV